MCDGSCFEVPKTTRTIERKQKQTLPVKALKKIFSKRLAVAPTCFQIWCLFGSLDPFGCFLDMGADMGDLPDAPQCVVSARFPVLRLARSPAVDH